MSELKDLYTLPDLPCPHLFTIEFVPHYEGGVTKDLDKLIKDLTLVVTKFDVDAANNTVKFWFVETTSISTLAALNFISNCVNGFYVRLTFRDTAGNTSYNASRFIDCKAVSSSMLVRGDISTKMLMHVFEIKYRTFSQGEKI